MSVGIERYVKFDINFDPMIEKFIRLKKNARGGLVLLLIKSNLPSNLGMAKQNSFKKF
jgi:hypothetical protein